ncbi:MAG: nucleotidyl transferase AbiEii/AbiGii toxin family protein [Candidatus Omnitrophota bacterium]
MAKEILSSLQKKFILLFSKNKELCKQFYLSGGTALSQYYLQHRYSEDLDFFCFKQFEILSINAFLKENKKKLGIKKIDFQQSFNRNLFFIHTKDEALKAEFTCYPFEQIEKPVKKNGMLVDSLMDIAVNKAFTIFQNPRSRDFIDLYLILNNYDKVKFEALFKMAGSKFDSQIDPIQLGAQLMKAEDIQDLPRMLVEISHEKWRNFFLKQAKLLSKQLFK